MKHFGHETQIVDWRDTICHELDVPSPRHRSLGSSFINQMIDKRDNPQMYTQFQETVRLNS